MAMTPNYDNTVIWVFKIYLDSSTVYLSTEDITLTNTYDGQVLKIDQYDQSLSDGELSYTGGMAVLGQTSLTISNCVDNSVFSDWFDSFYPNNSIYLMNRKVRLGVVWSNATSDSQITWLDELSIVDYAYGGASTELTLRANNEFVNINIPHYKVQSDYDDGISYIEYVSTDEQGAVLPAVYGDYSTSWTLLYSPTVPRLFAKAILFDKETLNYKYAYHKCHTTESNDYLFKYLEGSKNFLVMDADTTIKTNDYSGSSIQLNPTTRGYGEEILGFTYLSNFAVGSETNLPSIKEIMDDSLTNYITLAVGEQVALKIDGDLSTSQVGLISPINNLNLRFYTVSSSVGGTGTINLRYWTERGYSTAAVGSVNTTSTQNYLGFGTSNSAKPSLDLPWTFEELCNTEFVIYNAGSYPLRVYSSFIYVGGIKIQQYYQTIKTTKGIIRIKRDR